MGRKSIEDVMNEIEDFLNSCKTSALSSNKIVVPRDEFDELFGDLKVKILTALLILFNTDVA